MIFEPTMIINNLTVDDLAIALRVSHEMAAWWLDERGGNLRNGRAMQLGEFLTSRCDDCQEVIKVYDDANWRLKMHPIRCRSCAQELINEGHDSFEAYYVC